MIGSAHVLPTYRMQFHFIGITKGGYTTIIDPEGTPRIICFSEKQTARKCISYISEYRSSIWCLARYEFTGTCCTYKC